MTQPYVYFRYVVAAFLSAWLADFLFYKSPLGISSLIWFGMLLVCGFVVALLEKVRPARVSWLLAGLILAAAAVPAVRAEPFTIGMSFLLALVLVLLLVATFRSGFWPFFRIWDYVVSFFEVAINAIARPLTRSVPPAAVEGQEAPPTKAKTGLGKKIGPVLLGLALALPVILILTALLTSADPIFAQRVEAFIGVFKFENLPELLARLVFILALTFLFTGALLHALAPKKAAVQPDPNKAAFKPFLGFTETSIILGAVVLLFTLFVVIQFQYLFGGQTNITAAGFTYAEYARRGFNELVGVAVLSLGLYVVLDSVARRDTPAKTRWFQGGAALLLALVLVILASGLQRLMLYQQAYGLTRLRLQTLIFIPWLGVLLLAALVLALANRSGRLGIVLMVVVTGFCLTFPIVNMDAAIVRYNVQRAAAGAELDSTYLLRLSSDAVPAMIKAYQSTGLPEGVHEQLATALACKTYETTTAEIRPWQGFNFSLAGANTLLTDPAAEWAQFPTRNEAGDLRVNVKGTWFSCYPAYEAMD